MRHAAYAASSMLLFSMCIAAHETHAAELDVTIGFLSRERPALTVLSNLETIPDDISAAGVALGLADNSTTGKFLNQKWSLENAIIFEDENIAEKAKAILKSTRFIVADLPSEDLTALADMPEAKGAIIFNVRAADESLRDAECRANLLHTIPSYTMLTDALAQFAVSKKWTDWALIASADPANEPLVEAYEKSITKFRLKLREKKLWTFEADMRRNAAAEVPLFLQDLPDHDLLIVADAKQDYARYILYNTWLPRPIAGSEGLTPSAWAPVVEESGAAQMQSRFLEMTDRTMRPEDYASWLAVRAIGEAVTRTASSDSGTVRDYMLSDSFELAGFKGRPLTFRQWNGQMRQPIPLTHQRALTAMAPIEGFLHQINELDTLGLDQPESRCSAFKK